MLLPPSPKLQLQPVISPLPGVEASLKFTARVASPAVGVPEKSAVELTTGEVTVI